jgi:hypothetical protein
MPKNAHIADYENTKKPRSVTPIPSTIEHIKGFPKKLIIFKVASSSFWWTRCHFEGKPYKRSTKTESKRDAIKFAKDFYEQLITNKRVGVSSNARVTSFVICAEGVMEEDALKAERGELSKQYAINQKRLIQGHIYAFFSSYQIVEVTYQLQDKFRAYLAKKGLSTNTIKMHFVTLNKIFSYALRNSYIATAPTKPTVKQVDNARGYFELWEYKELRRASIHLQNTVSELRHATVTDEDGNSSQLLRRIVITKELLYLIPLMVFTFIRPTDLKVMRHRHVEIRTSDKGDYLFMPLPETKKHARPITSLPKAAYYYKRLRAYQQARGYGGEDDFVFQPEHENRDTAYRKLSRQFDAAIQLTQLKESKDGDVRTLYSLRHTSIMYRLIYGGEINLLSLARNARTSVGMIERFYASQLESSKVTDELHAKKRAKKGKPPTFITVPMPLDPMYERAMLELGRLHGLEPTLKGNKKK